VEVFDELIKNKANVRGYKITKEPKLLRHFTAHFEQL
jgi:tryptophanase